MKVIRVPVRCNQVEHTVVIPFSKGPPVWFSVGFEQRRANVKSRIVRHREQTIISAITLLAARWLQNPNLPRLDKNRLWKLMAKANSEALGGWASYMPRSAFDIQLCECLHGWDQRRVS